MPDNLDLSDPTTFTEPPFPWLLPAPIKHSNLLSGDDKLFLYGTSGSRKSHLLAALVYHLVRKGKRVIYIPDCHALLPDSRGVIWTALHFTFYDSDSLNDIKNMHAVDELIQFMFDHREVYIIVGQLNALDVADNDCHSSCLVLCLGELCLVHTLVIT